MVTERQQLLDQKTQVMRDLGIRIADNRDTAVNAVDFSGLAEASHTEVNVLTTTEESLAQSFDEGMSAIFLMGQRAVGHARFIPLLDQNLQQELSIDSEVPQIWEMGTGLMLEECRGKGINILLRQALLARFMPQMVTGELLAIATTKTPELRRLVDAMADLSINPDDRYVIDFRFTNRENISFIAPFTCVCNPEFGTGYQYGTSCNQSEVQTAQTNGFRSGIELPLIGAEQKKMACTVFVSSTSLVTHTNRLLEQQFGTRQNLINQLSERGYYND